jgi:hypothetical protein
MCCCNAPKETALNCIFYASINDTLKKVLGQNSSNYFYGYRNVAQSQMLRSRLETLNLEGKDRAYQHVATLELQSQ